MADFYNGALECGTFTDPTDIIFTTSGVTSLTLGPLSATFGVPLVGDGSGLTGITASSSPFTGGTVTGATIFSSGLSVSTGSFSDNFSIGTQLEKTVYTSGGWSRYLNFHNTFGGNKSFFGSYGSGSTLIHSYWVNSSVSTPQTSTNGIVLLNNGNVGIGTLTPIEKLEVSGNTIISGTLSASTISATTFYGSSKKMTNPKIGMFGAYTAGVYYDYGLNGTVATTKAMAANECSISPMVWPEDFSADRIGLNITATGATGTMVRFLIFDSDSDGKPNNLIYSSTTASTTTTGFKEITLSQTFEKNVVYWAGAQFNGICTMSALPPSGCYHLGATSSVSTPAISIRNILGSFTPPANFAAIGAWTSVRTTLAPPLIRFRKA